MNALSHVFTAAAGRCNVGGNAKATRRCGVSTVARGALTPRAGGGRRASEGRRGAVPMHRARQWKQLGPQGTQQLHGFQDWICALLIDHAMAMVWSHCYPHRIKL
uniref:Uncharacterized protein n=1 Tax=Mantoniella antarctica TaxID=81844 RepID=A0A7S0SH04_9CHLO